MENNKCQVKIQSQVSKTFEITIMVRQGDSFPCILFHLALEKVVRDAGIQSRSTIFYRYMQLQVYDADDW
mgnify:CR=1 FL=1